MTYTLLIGDRSYSSWSLRGWLSLAAFDLPMRVESVRMYQDAFAPSVAEFGGEATVPVLRTPGGELLTDSLAIAWHLSEAFPEAGLLPREPGARATAMNLVAAMHSGFMGLRSACPMNLRTSWQGFEPGAEVLADLERVERLWGEALAKHGGPWLCCEYSLADVFFAPLATRLMTYGLPVSEQARAYARSHLAHPTFRRWRAMGLVEGPEQSFYEMGLPRVPFPAPQTIPAEAVAQGPSENATCPYSGDPVTDFLQIDGRIFGFCNPFCRDKTVVDPEAWPAFMQLYRNPA